ncbi:hypothetical protein AVEN_160815-1 [Araneus ventricosus]|uniref:Uncharacterized protein n=1 Tax=Araneus ventricosus TaxID=182803 RepID=A0A4Y2J0I4_ARAVE|nr:hypothetical protein AVEN_160815-1 [Araneus ventricosus]
MTSKSSIAREPLTEMQMRSLEYPAKRAANTARMQRRSSEPVSDSIGIDFAPTSKNAAENATLAEPEKDPKQELKVAYIPIMWALLSKVQWVQLHGRSSVESCF